MNMGMWTFLTIICVTAILAGVWETWIKYRRRELEKTPETDGLLERIEEMERRIANLESICIEQERVQKFDDLLIRAAVERRE